MNIKTFYNFTREDLDNGDYLSPTYNFAQNVIRGNCRQKQKSWADRSYTGQQKKKNSCA